jgi:hypothetical protein
METSFTPRYQGRRWKIIYGSYTGIEYCAVNQLQRLVQRYLPYVIKVVPTFNKELISSDHLILVGTPKNNPAIKEILSIEKLEVDHNEQGYLIACLDSPWEIGCRMMLVTGITDRGVLNAVQGLGKHLAISLATKYLTSPEGRPNLRKSFDSLPDFQIREAPIIEYRGIWTWGYVIQNYRRFFDNMVRLRLNTAIIWNDVPPINSPQVIEYAHHLGISIIFGFQWGWGLPGLNLSDRQERLKIKEMVLENYRTHYLLLDLDGIYFQTLTEHSTIEKDGITTAQAACMLVNDTSSELLTLNPNLQIFFGLHATSIKENYRDLITLDPRVSIIWEDAGGIPYSYEPEVDPDVPFEKTLDYSRRIATFRPGTRFGLVAKGWTTLRWEDEFEHHGVFILGEQDQVSIQQRLSERHSQWNRVNALWMKNFHFASRFYREINSLAPAGMIVTGLVEDGGFEEVIQPSVALFAESVWNPNQPDEALVQAALNPYYQDY